MATVTASVQFAPNVKSNHTGVQVAGSRFSTNATLTAASVILLARVPNGATLLDWWAYITPSSANQTVEIGTSATPSGIAAIFSLTASASADNTHIGANGYRPPRGDLLPVRISLSDDSEPANVWVRARLAAAISESMVFTFTLFYTNDGTTAPFTIR